jgi:hypothetical protein
MRCIHGDDVRLNGFCRRRFLPIKIWGISENCQKKINPVDVSVRRFRRPGGKSVDGIQKKKGRGRKADAPDKWFFVSDEERSGTSVDDTVTGGYSR